MLADGEIGSIEPSIVGFDDIAITLGDRQRSTKAFTYFGEEDRYAASEEPVNFLVASGRDPEENHFRDPLQIPFRVGERQGTSPGTTEYQPAVDIQVLPQMFYISDQIRGSIARQVGIESTGMWRAPLTVPLIEKHETVGTGIKKPAVPGRTARTRATMQNDGWLPLWIATRLPVDGIAITYL